MSNNNLILIGEENGNSSSNGEIIAIKNALQSKLVNETDDYNLFEKIKKLIAEAYSDLKFTLPSATDIEYMTLKIQQNLRKHRRNLRIDELAIAFENGIHGEYGKFFGPSLVDFCNFISQYCMDQNRLLALAEVKQPEKKENPPSPEQIYSLCVDNTIKGFKQHLEKADPENVIYPAIYDFLFRIKFFEITQSEIDDLINQSYARVQSQLQTKKQNADKMQRVNLGSEIQRVLNEKQSHGAVIAGAKKIFVNSLFQSMIDVILIDEEQKRALTNEEKAAAVEELLIDITDEDSEIYYYRTMIQQPEYYVLNQDITAARDDKKIYGRKGDKVVLLKKYQGKDGIFLCVRNVSRFPDNGGFDVNEKLTTKI